jgi:3-phytase
MPGNLIPADFYSPEEQAVLRLSSKSHWDVPIKLGRRTVHLLASHPTPPVFDGPEDRNGRRNHDEIRFWADYVRPSASSYIYDDEGRRGGLRPGRPFVIAGDQNSDPLDGDSYPGAIQQLTEHPLVNTRVTPASAGAVEATALQAGANLTHRSDPRLDTADFSDTSPGNLRADYVLPRKKLKIVGAGVFWPVRADPLSRLTGFFDPQWSAVGGFPTSDHRLVWADPGGAGSLNRARWRPHRPCRGPGQYGPRDRPAVGRARTKPWLRRVLVTPRAPPGLGRRPREGDRRPAGRAPR